MRRKTPRLQELATLPNYLDMPEGMAGNWRCIFGNDDPITLELGCGQGHYTLALAEKYPERNIVGIDIKGIRLWKGAKFALERNLPNARFARLRIEFLTTVFGKGEVDEIWIPFPDPYPKPCKWKKRLISQRFIEAYKQVLKPDGIIHFKTDNDALFAFALEHLATIPDIQIQSQTWDLHTSDLLDELTGIPTKYEEKFRAEGLTIKYLRLGV